MNYKVTANGKKIEYGALVEKSRFSAEEWSAIYAEIVKQNQPEVFERKDEFSYAGTHPKWVADAVNANTLNKEDTQEDVSDMLERCGTLEELKKELTEYFEL